MSAAVCAAADAGRGADRSRGAAVRRGVSAKSARRGRSADRWRILADAAEAMAAREARWRELCAEKVAAAYRRGGARPFGIVPRAVLGEIERVEGRDVVALMVEWVRHIHGYGEDVRRLDGEVQGWIIGNYEARERAHYSRRSDASPDDREAVNSAFYHVLGHTLYFPRLEQWRVLVRCFWKRGDGQYVHALKRLVAFGLEAAKRSADGLKTGESRGGALRAREADGSPKTAKPEKPENLSSRKFDFFQPSKTSIRQLPQLSATESKHCAGNGLE